MESLTLHDKTYEIDVTKADFATRRELVGFAMANASPRGHAALVAEFLFVRHPAVGLRKVLKLNLEIAKGAFRLGGMAWEDLAKKGWKDTDIVTAGNAILAQLVERKGPSAEGVLDEEGFSTAQKEPGTSGPTGSPPSTDSQSSGSTG
jgi:hypothetical protein